MCGRVKPEFPALKNITRQLCKSLSLKEHLTSVKGSQEGKATSVSEVMEEDSTGGIFEANREASEAFWYPYYGA